MVKIRKNDVLLRDQDRWLHFSDPHKVIVAEKLDAVIPALHEIERLVDANNLHAAGFLSYEAASAFDSAHLTTPTTGFPYLWFGLYPKPAIVNLPKSRRPKEILNWQPSIDYDAYNSAIAQIKEQIAQGRTYQVNYTMRVQADFKINAWEFFLDLAQSQNNHAAYIDTGRYIICSASPESFFELEGENITCRPMKGTVKRGRTTVEDQEQSNWLRISEKNRAENIMIVDMIRNDLGQIAQVGSIRVPELFSIERYPTLWQMTSTVAAQTKASLTDIFRALFPCASITGAPKFSTMNIIRGLETTPRKIYTGAIGYIAPKRKAKFNVAIRTVLIDREMRGAEYGVGGGIVWDSNSVDEYAEALLKAEVLTRAQPEFSLLDTMLWTPNEGFFLRDKHTDRLLESANYFDFCLSRDRIEDHLNELSFASPQRVRLLVDKVGNIKTESISFQPIEKNIRARLAANPIDSNDVFLFHKTTQRAVYEDARAGFPDYDDVLLYNERRELTEFIIGNLVVELDGHLLTPPIACGLLSGTFRTHLVETSQVWERVVLVDRLKDCTQIFRINSIRKWERVHISL